MEVAMTPADRIMRTLLENLGKRIAPRNVPSCRISAVKMAAKYGLAAMPASYKMGHVEGSPVRNTYHIHTCVISLGLLSTMGLA
jgi:hypothetical protein